MYQTELQSSFLEYKDKYQTLKDRNKIEYGQKSRAKIIYYDPESYEKIRCKQSLPNKFVEPYDEII